MKNCFLKQRKVIEGTIFLYFLIKCHLLAEKQLAVSCTAGGQINILVTWGLWKKAPQTCSCQQLFFPPFFFALLNFFPFNLFSSSSSFLLIWMSMPQAWHRAPQSPSCGSGRAQWLPPRSPAGQMLLLGGTMAPGRRYGNAGTGAGAGAWPAVESCHIASALTESLINA